MKVHSYTVTTGSFSDELGRVLSCQKFHRNRSKISTPFILSLFLSVKGFPCVVQWDTSMYFHYF